MAADHKQQPVVARRRIRRSSRPWPAHGAALHDRPRSILTAVDAHPPAQHRRPSLGAGHGTHLTRTRLQAGSPPLTHRPLRSDRRVEPPIRTVTPVSPTTGRRPPVGVDRLRASGRVLVDEGDRVADRLSRPAVVVALLVRRCRGASSGPGRQGGRASPSQSRESRPGRSTCRAPDLFGGPSRYIASWRHSLGSRAKSGQRYP